MTNKLASILSISMLVFLFTACSFNSEEKQPTSESEEENKTDTETTENNKNEPEVNPLLDIEDKTIIRLVNKEYSLSESDVPDDLVTVDVPTILDNPEVNQLREVAADALKAMFAKAKESDIILYARSGYRSYETQVQLFQNYTERNGEEAANRYSARAGQSEHQTGLVMDVTSESVNYLLEEAFGTTDEGKWLREHAHEFGFIIRYPEDKEAITGYIYEPWHIRYIGIDMARAVYHSGLTYEEFLKEEDILYEVSSES